MKTRTKYKIRKYFKKIGVWSYWAYVPVLWVLISVNSYTRLHSGASIDDVDGHRYVPVVSEVLFMMLAAIFLLIGLRVVTKLNLLLLSLVGFVLFGLIWWFGYWSFKYTLQDSAEGFWTVTLIIASTGLFAVLALWYESYTRRKRKSDSRNKKVDM